MNPCEVSTPPVVEARKVTFNVVHNESGRVFRCAMADFDSVEVTALPAGMTNWAEGEERALVAERAKEYARENEELFGKLFDELSDPGLQDLEGRDA